MKCIRNTLLVICLVLTGTIYAQEVTINPNGIFLPAVENESLPFISTPGHLLYNLDSRRIEWFTGNFEWSGLTAGQLIDDDNDTEVKLTEGLTQGSSDIIQFAIDNTNIATFSKITSNYGRLSFTGGSSIFLGNSSGRDVTTDATDNIAIGSMALANNEAADFNVAIGSEALENMATQTGQTNFGGKNVAIGHRAMADADAFSGQSVALGYQAGMEGGSQSIFLGHEAGKGASDLTQALYISNKGGDNPLIFGNFNEGKLGINYNGNNLEDALHVEATSEDHGPMRIRIDGTTKFRVHKNGGLSIGTFAAPFDNGLKVANLDEDGAPTPLFADDRGNVTRRSGLKWISLGPGMFRDDSWNNDDFSMSPTALGTGMQIVNVFSPVQIPDDAKIKKLKIWLNNSNTSTGQILVRLYKVQIIPASGLDVTKLIELNPPPNSDEVEFHISHENADGTLNELVSNGDTHYYVEIVDNRNYNIGGPPPFPKPIDMVAVGYEY